MSLNESKDLEDLDEFLFKKNFEKIDESSVIKYFLDQQFIRTNKKWHSYTSEGKIFVVGDKIYEFRYVPYGTDVKSFPKGSFYAICHGREVIYYKRVGLTLKEYVDVDLA